MKTKTALALLPFAAGCASPPVEAPPPSHPASPAATEAPRPEPSRTLAGEPAVRGEVEDGHGMHEGMHDVHGDMDHDAHEETEHDMHEGMHHDRRDPGDEGSRGGPR